MVSAAVYPGLFISSADGSRDYDLLKDRALGPDSSQFCLFGKTRSATEISTKALSLCQNADAPNLDGTAII